MFPNIICVFVFLFCIFVIHFVCSVFLHCFVYCFSYCLSFCIYVVGSKSFRPDIQKPRQMEKAAGKYIVPSMVRLITDVKSVLK
jgi:hypothetical protein